jgi:DNA-binding beta-propeller fold protein YncE
VSDYDDNQEVVIDGATNQIVARVDLQGRQPVGVAVDLLTNHVWVTLDGPDGKVDILDGATNTLLQTITVGNCFVNNLAINPTTRRVYIAYTDAARRRHSDCRSTESVTAQAPRA